MDRALDYVRGVVSGEVLVCQWVRLACQRHLDDLARSEGEDFPYRFDPAKAEKACRFAERFPHVKGHWAIPQQGKPDAIKLRLEPWQCFLWCAIHGWVDRATGFRRFWTAYIEVPRKNGKSIMGAVNGLYFFAADGEQGAEVYSGATSEKQAWEVFRPAKAMAERSPDFRTKYGVQVNAKGLVILGNGSRFEPVIGKPGDGASPSLAIVDEYHEHPDSTLYDTMKTGQGSRNQPLLLVITTAGSDLGGPCYALHDEVQKMLTGVQPDEHLFGVVYTLDEKDDWTTEEALRKANPNYGVSVNAERLRADQLKAISTSRQQNVFKTKHLNIWVTARDAWMNMEWWNRQADPSLRVEDFLGELCYAGADLASKLDLASVCRVFRKDVEGEPHYYAFWRHYLPSATVDDPTNRHYQGWAKDGWLTVTDGDMIDFDRIRDELFENARAHGILEVAFDQWGSEGIVRDCQEEGLTALLVPQTTKYLSDPMKSVEALVKSGQFHHVGDPVAGWAISNVTCREDPNENVFPRKERTENKIDPAVALFMAMYRATLSPEPEPQIRVLA